METRTSCWSRESTSADKLDTQLHNCAATQASSCAATVTEHLCNHDNCAAEQLW